MMMSRTVTRYAALMNAALLLAATSLFFSPPAWSQEALPRETPPAAQPEPVRVGIVKGPQSLFSTIETSRAPFVLSEPSEADVIWDVEQSTAVSRGDLLMSRIDATVLGSVIDRTFAVREIRKLAASRVIDVKLGEDGKDYTLDDTVALVANGVRGRYLTAVNVAADGTLQLLFPVYESHDPHMAGDRWTYQPKVDLPLGTDCTVVIATSKPAGDLVSWLRAHDGKHDAFLLPAVLAGTIEADGDVRIGTAGLFTH